MGQWKVTLTMRLRPELKDGLADVANREHRTLGNLGEILMEWAFEQLRIAGSTERLRKYKIRADSEPPKRNT